MITSPLLVARSSDSTCHTIFISSLASMAPPECRLPFGCGATAERHCRLGSVEEMADAGEDHGETEAGGGGDDVIVANGAAGLNHGRGAGFGGFFHTIWERKERVGGYDAAL